MTDTKHSAERAAFEAWYHAPDELGLRFPAEYTECKEPDGKYTFNFVQNRWLGWQARAAIAAAAPVGEPVAQRAAVRLHEFTSDRPYTEGQKFFEITVLDRAQCRDGLELYAAPVPAAAPDHSLPTDISDRLRRHATGGPNLATNTPNELLLTAAAECERFYGGMMNWKECAQAKDKTIAELREKLAAIPAAAPKAALTDANILASLEIVKDRGNFHSMLIPTDAAIIAFARHIEAASGPNAALVEALRKIIEMNRQHAEDQYGDADKAESWSCIVVAREALAAAGVEAGK